MIHGLILCEGNTDRTLVGCYIEGVSRWQYVSEIKNNPFRGEKISWYSDGNDEFVGIWENGGCDFNKTIEIIAKRESMEHKVERVLIITDHDDQYAEQSRPQSIGEKIKKTFKCDNNVDSLKVNDWISIGYESGFGRAECRVGYLLIPSDESGALETFMLNALSEEKAENKKTIDQVERFINDFNSEIYLKSRRDRIKSKLGITLSIFEPDKSLYIMKEIIQSVSWEKYDISNKQFAMVKEMIEE